MSNPNYPEGVSERDIDRIGEPMDGGGETMSESTTCGEVCDVVDNKRLFDPDGTWILSDKLLEFIDSEIRRNLKEFAMEINPKVQDFYMYGEACQSRIKSALTKRGAKP